MRVNDALTLATSGCQNCYKCIRQCPVKAINFKENLTRINPSRCIACGNCFIICPHNHKAPRNHLIKIKSFISNGQHMLASLDATYAAYFGDDAGRLPAALRFLGFQVVEETSVGMDALIDSIHETYRQWDRPYFITAGCASANLLIQKYHPELRQYMAPVVPAMIAHGKILKETHGQASRVIHFGPCIASRVENLWFSKVDKAVDSALTFRELEEWLEEDCPHWKELPLQPMDRQGSQRAVRFSFQGNGSFYEQVTPASLRTFVQVEGVAQCREAIVAMERGELQPAFVDISFCRNGCLGGPAFNQQTATVYRRRGMMEKLIEERSSTHQPFHEKADKPKQHLPGFFARTFPDRQVVWKMPPPERLEEIIKEMGKFKPAEELNCGTCGFDSCRERAIAVYNHMANDSMCLPYMRKKIETISDLIFEHSPNFIFTVNRELKVTSINPASVKHLKIETAEVGVHLAGILDFEDYLEVFETGTSQCGKKVYLESQGLTVIQHLLYIREQDTILAILNNVTREEEKEQELRAVRRQTVETAQEVIHRQMRVAQEICSLLGETTAETKVILDQMMALTLDRAEES
ncbi:[Fe-Fe] hydrogenase large subunit C-terminal domain-containing protein [Anoxynatronum sibiricum]|uniref:[Fe-Fe] hydrogenase large subunit C-terminal domain-containing protein n=1 Tax=Anoxynatronum sibiricum TaxID=210623 RepID=A0ABU9VTU7_9CLOT